jgi:hypothetical protein
MSARYRLLQLSLVVLSAGCGGGGGGASAPTKNTPSQQEVPSALSEMKAASDFAFAHFRSVAVSVDAHSFLFVGNHVFLKLFPTGDPGASVFLGEIGSRQTWQAGIVLDNATEQLSWEVYSDANESYEGFVDLTAVSAVMIQGTPR